MRTVFIVLAVLFGLGSLITIAEGDSAGPGLILTLIFGILAVKYKKKTKKHAASTSGLSSNNSNNIVKVDNIAQTDNLFRRVYNQTFKAHMMRLGVSQANIEEMLSFLQNDVDFCELFQHEQHFYAYFFAGKNWTWPEYEQLKQITYDLVKQNIRIKTSPLWWVFQADIASDKVMPEVIAKMRAFEKRQSLNLLGIPIESGMISADLSKLLLKADPEQFKLTLEDLPQRFLQEEESRKRLLFSYVLRNIQYAIINTCNFELAIAQKRQLAPIKSPWWRNEVLKQWENIPSIPPCFPGDNAVLDGDENFSEVLNNKKSACSNRFRRDGYRLAFYSQIGSLNLFSKDEQDEMLEYIESRGGGGNLSLWDNDIYDAYFKGKTITWPDLEIWRNSPFYDKTNGQFLCQLKGKSITDCKALCRQIGFYIWAKSDSFSKKLFCEELGGEYEYWFTMEEDALEDSPVRQYIKYLLTMKPDELPPFFPGDFTELRNILPPPGGSRKH